MLIHYASLDDKRQRFMTDTVDAVFAAAEHALQSPRFRAWALALPGDLPGLHEAVRRQRYVPEDGPRDLVQEAEHTLRQGGDCEDWAVVLLAALKLKGYDPEFIVAGDDLDPARHVFVRAAGRVLDPKGSQGGRPFGQHASWPRLRSFSWPLRGAGADDDPMIRSAADAAKWLSPAQIKTYLQKVEAQQGTKAKIALTQALQGGYHNRTRNQVLAYIGAAIDRAAATISAKTGTPVAGQAAYAELVTPRDLLDTNIYLAAEWIAKAPVSVAQVLAQHFGVRLDAPDEAMRGAVALQLAHLATSQGWAFDEWLQAYSEEAAQGAGKEVHGLAKLVRHPLKWARSVIREVGKGVSRFAQNILNAEKDVPWLSQFFLKPLGFIAQARLLRETGRALEEGSISAFDEKALARDTAGTLTAAGQALLVAAPFLPPPWNVAAAALGALSVAAGNAINRQIDLAEAKRAAAKDPYYGARVVQVDQFGRELAPDGLPLDAYQRQQEIERRRQAQAAQPGWRQGQDGLWYAVANGYQVAAAVDGAGKILRLWVWNGAAWSEAAA